MRLNIRRLILTVSILVAVTAFQSSAFGQCDEHSYYWAAGSGDWSVPENWQHEEWDPEIEECVMVPGVPDSDDWVDIINGGTANVNGTASCHHMNVESSGLELMGGSLSVVLAANANWGGWFSQTGGTASFLGLDLGSYSGSNGSYDLEDGELHTTNVDHIGFYGHGMFTQSGGRFEAGEHLVLGRWPGAKGTYTLIDGLLSSDSMFTVAYAGSGTFIQDGGIVEIITGYGEFEVGFEAGSNGTYELYEGELSAKTECIGRNGTGRFNHNGGTHVTDWLTLGDNAGGNGTYEMSGGTLNVRGICVGYKGTGSFVMDGATINGTTEEALMVVNGGTGTLTGPGTFNITVTYESDEIYGTNGNQSVHLGFDRNCLTVGGEYNVTQITPADFAGGTVPNLLASSVFDVSFGGSYCGELELAIPYDEDEVAALGASETSLLLLRETGPGTYEQLPILEIDTESDVIYALSSSFGKFAVQAPEAVTVIVHGYVDGPVPQWTYNMRNAILDRTAETCASMVVIVFDWAKASRRYVFDPDPLAGKKANLVLKEEARHLANQLIDTHLVTADPSCHVHLIGHSRGGPLVGYAAYLLNNHFGRCVVNHMTILDGIDKTSTPCGWYLQDPEICGNGADWTDNYYQTNDLLCHGQSRPDCDLNEKWEFQPHGGFAEAYTDTIVNVLEWMGYWWSLGGGGWDDPAKPHGRAFCSQSGTETVINGDYETQDLLGWSTLLGTPSVVLHGADNYVCQMEEQSSVAIAQTIMTPAHARFLLFDFAFTDQGDGDSLTVTLGGTTIFTFVGTDFESSDLVSSGLIGISALAGQTSCELVFTLNSVGEPGATVLLDNIRVITTGDLDADGDVDLSDFSIFAAHWLHDSCNAPDWCDGSDIAPEIPDGVVDVFDLAVLAEHWLEGTTP